MDAARDIFQDAARFEDAFVKAMSEAGNDAIAALCKLLRTDPKQLGELKDSKAIEVQEGRTAGRSDHQIANRDHRGAAAPQRQPRRIRRDGAEGDGRGERR